jgi:hypothetical protein
MNENGVRPAKASARVSRRRFLKLTAAGAAAALAAPAATLARAAAPAKRATPAKPPAATAGTKGHVASAKEIEKLKGYLEGSLKAVRNFELPPGSDMAFSFRAMKTNRARGQG